MRSVRGLSVAVALLAAVVLLLGGLTGASPVHAQPAWASAGTAPIHPGVMTFTDGGQCTANFVFFDSSNNVYIGQAAHCAGTGGNTDTNGCTSPTLQEGTPVQVEGASHPGTMVYSSWVQMQAEHESDANTCAFNDLALVQLDPADAANVNPSVPHWGGPSGLAASTGSLEQVYSYGNSELRGGISLLSPKIGLSLGSDSGNWNNSVYTVTPGIPGDSGSGFMNSTGQAFGILSTVQIAPLPASNGVGGLANELNYLHGHTSFGSVQLANGTVPFKGGLPI